MSLEHSGIWNLNFAKMFAGFCRLIPNFFVFQKVLIYEILSMSTRVARGLVPLWVCEIFRHLLDLLLLSHSYRWIHFNSLDHPRSRPSGGIEVGIICWLGSWFQSILWITNPLQRFRARDFLGVHPVSGPETPATRARRAQKRRSAGRQWPWASQVNEAVAFSCRGLRSLGIMCNLFI